MEIKLVAYGIAKDIFESHEKMYILKNGGSLGSLRKELFNQYPALQQLASLKFAVNEEYQSDDFALKEKDEVVIIPPVSGG